MHEQWSDLIPYYVNRTLPDGERAAFERHLANCADCRRAVDDWNLVAGTVYQEVDHWAQQTPALSAQVRARLGPPPSSNGHGHYTPVFSPDETRSVYAMRRPSRRYRLPLTMVAAAVMIVAVGVIVIMIAGRGDESPTPLSELNGTETQIHTPASTLGAVTATPLPTQARTTTPAEVADLGILPPLKTPTPKPTLTATLRQPTQTPRPPATLTPTLYWPVTPTAAYQYGIGSGFIMVTTVQIGDIPAGTPVRISHAWYDGTTWIYAIVTEDDQTTYAEARELQLAFAPDVTPGPIPPAAYQGAIGMGYLMVTTAQVGSIPAGTRVRISHAWHNGYRWLYAIQAYGGEDFFDAEEWQIAYAPDVTPGPTPTAMYQNQIWAGYVLLTTERVGTIPPGTRVQITAGQFDGFGWIYDVEAEDGTTAQARTAQLTLDPNPAPSNTPPPTPTPSPTATAACPYSNTLTDGCPTTQKNVLAAFQAFENGYMLWRDDTDVIYVLYNQDGEFEWYTDTWTDGEPVNIGETPPPGRTAPTRGFAKLWVNEPGMRESLGWALSTETGYTALWETYAGGDTYVRLPDGRALRLNETVGWAFE